MGDIRFVPLVNDLHKPSLLLERGGAIGFEGLIMTGYDVFMSKISKRLRNHFESPGRYEFIFFVIDFYSKLIKEFTFFVIIFYYKLIKEFIFFVFNFYYKCSFIIVIRSLIRILDR